MIVINFEIRNGTIVSIVNKEVIAQITHEMT